LQLILIYFPNPKEIIYVDEKFEKVDFATFSEKLNTQLFLTSLVEMDTIIFKKLRFKEYFGSLGKKKSQLNKLYHQRYHVDSTKVWLIHYTDSLPKSTDFQREYDITLFDCFNEEVLSSEMYIRGTGRHSKTKSDRSEKIVTHYKDYLRRNSWKFKKLNNNKGSSLLHFYEYNKGYSFKRDHKKWIEDDNHILKGTFSDGLFLSYKLLVIYPNGDFYTSHYFKSFSDQKKLLKYKPFKKLKKKWLTKIEKLN